MAPAIGFAGVGPPPRWVGELKRARPPAFVRVRRKRYSDPTGRSNPTVNIRPAQRTQGRGRPTLRRGPRQRPGRLSLRSSRFADQKRMAGKTSRNSGRAGIRREVISALGEIRHHRSVFREQSGGPSPGGAFERTLVGMTNSCAKPRHLPEMRRWGCDPRCRTRNRFFLRSEETRLIQTIGPAARDACRRQGDSSIWPTPDHRSMDERHRRNRTAAPRRKAGSSTNTSTANSRREEHPRTNSKFHRRPQKPASNAGDHVAGGKGKSAPRPHDTTSSRSGHNFGGRCLGGPGKQGGWERNGSRGFELSREAAKVLPWTKFKTPARHRKRNSPWVDDPPPNPQTGPAPWGRQGRRLWPAWKKEIRRGEPNLPAALRLAEKRRVAPIQPSPRGGTVALPTFAPFLRGGVEDERSSLLGVRGLRGDPTGAGASGAASKSSHNQTPFSDENGTALESCPFRPRRPAEPLTEKKPTRRGPNRRKDSARQNLPAPPETFVANNGAPRS